jgi:hypothetical protein
MWLTGWNYRKQINITGSSGAGTNYQVLLKIGESSGASGYDFHIGGNSANFPSGKNQGGDLRFTASDGTTLLDFWVEKVTGSSPNRVAYVWVKVSADLGSNQSIYCYYGNSSASNYSNGDNTFLLFDDFNGSSIDTNKWTFISGSGGLYLDGNSNLVIESNSNPYQMKSINSFSIGAAVHTYARGTAGNGYGHYCDFFNNSGNNLNAYCGSPQTSTQMEFTTFSGGSYTTATYTVSNRMSQYYHYKITWRSGEGRFYQDDNLIATHTTNIPTSNQSAFFYPTATSGNQIKCDWVFVKKFVSSEPAFGSAGNEETPSSTIVARRGLIMSM